MFSQLQLKVIHNCRQTNKAIPPLLHPSFLLYPNFNYYFFLFSSSNLQLTSVLILTWSEVSLEKNMLLYRNMLSIIESTTTLLNQPHSKMGQSCAISWHKNDWHANRRCACHMLLCATLTPLKQIKMPNNFHLLVFHHIITSALRYV